MISTVSSRACRFTTQDHVDKSRSVSPPLVGDRARQGKSYARGSRSRKFRMAVSVRKVFEDPREECGTKGCLLLPFAVLLPFFVLFPSPFRSGGAPWSFGAFKLSAALLDECLTKHGGISFFSPPCYYLSTSRVAGTVLGSEKRAFSNVGQFSGNVMLLRLYLEFA